jgi:molybdopterin-guanine dinucleotide biosynthesis protein A
MWRGRFYLGKMMLRCGGIVLAGGRSRRMGLDKALLPFGPETMLQRVVRRLGEAVGPIVVVAAVGQSLPELPAQVRIVRDRTGDRGPLEGLAAGLSALDESVEAAYTTACDVPLVEPDFVSRMIALADGFDAAAVCEEGRFHPLSAVYRRELAPRIETLLAENRLRPLFLLQSVRTRTVSVEELIDVDPQLHSLANLNRPEDYFHALATAGFEAPAEIVQAMRDKDVDRED